MGPRRKPATPRGVEATDGGIIRLSIAAAFLILRIVTVVTYGAGGRGKVDGVAITAGCSFMIDTVSLAIAGMRRVKDGRAPGGGIVALVARRS